jgi:hypothetical protein
MAIKRKNTKSVTLHQIVLKKMKLDSIPLNAESLDNKVSKMTGPEFELFMVNLGPRAWKEATDNMSLNHAKKLVLMIMCRGDLLIPFNAYVTLHQNDARPAQHLYDLHLGGALSQCAIDGNDAKNAYMRLISKQCDEDTVLAILPVLKHNRHYFCLNKNLVKDVLSLKSKPRLNLTGWSCEKLYYSKLTSAMACAKLQRWSECFAHSLSALDCYQPGFDHLHDVFCYVALSGNSMSVPSSWCCAVLEEASQFSSSIEHLWQRILVFQGILIHNGHFALEQQLFDSSSNIFIQSTMFFQTLLTQHMMGLLAQIENILAFQFVRRKYHQDCTSSCIREPNFEYNFEEYNRLIVILDALASKLKMPGHKEYFRGYVYLYSTMMHVYKYVPSVLPQTQLTVAISCFEIAKIYMSKGDAFSKDLYAISSFLKGKFLTFGFLDAYFSEREMSKYTLGERNFLFRAMIITMYWKNKFQPFPLLVISTQARNMDKQVTNGLSYRNNLLEACVNIHSDGIYHKNNRADDDYPRVTTPRDTDVSQFWTKLSTAKNFTLVSQYAVDEPTTTAIPSSSEALLKKTKLGEQIYAFGYQICESYTTD